MRRRVLHLLVFLNVLLAAMVFLRPAVPQILPRGLFDCCKAEMTESGESYCCQGCCWFIQNCRSNEDCETEPGVDLAPASRAGP